MLDLLVRFIDEGIEQKDDVIEHGEIDGKLLVDVHVFVPFNAIADGGEEGAEGKADGYDQNERALDDSACKLKPLFSVACAFGGGCIDVGRSELLLLIRVAAKIAKSCFCTRDVGACGAGLFFETEDFGSAILAEICLRIVVRAAYMTAEILLSQFGHLFRCN